MNEPWNNDMRDALDRALHAAKHAESWLDEIDVEMLGEDGPAVQQATMLAFNLRCALVQLDSEQQRRLASDDWQCEMCGAPLREDQEVCERCYTLFK